MPLTEQAKNVIERPLPQDKIKQRPGKAGMTYDYVTPDFVINLLNEAFDYRWSTSIFYQAMHGNTAVVGINLTVLDADGHTINKAQFGSCEVNSGMGPGEAFKGAASDGMKKAATLLGVALELYLDDETPKQQFQRPAILSAPKPPARPPSAAPAPPRPPAPSSPVAPAVRPPAPPAPVQVPPGTTRAMPRPVVPASSAAIATPARTNPFGNSNTRAAVPAPAAPPAAVKSVAAPKTNPFAKREIGAGPSSTQLNALSAIAERRGLSQPEMIALVGVVDELGNPKQAFDELTHAEAIQIVKASQL